MARDAIPVVKQLHGDLYAEVATPDPTFTGEANPASIMHVCVGDGQTLVIVGVRPWHDQLHAVTVTEEGDEVQIAAWTTHRATAQSDADDDPFWSCGSVTALGCSRFAA